MAPARPIHDIFAGLAEPEPGLAGPEAATPGKVEPAAALRDGGHGDLPDVLVAEAIVSYAGTAPLEVAEHLAPFVTAYSPVPAAEPDAAAPDLADGLALLASVPPVAEPELAPPGEEEAADFGAGELQESADPMDLDFGEGAGLSEPQVAMESVEFDLSPTQPVPEPDPTEPEPTEPDPTQPGPTEPGPTEPDPAQDALGEA